MSHNGSVLIVEDDADIRASLATLVEFEGCPPVTAANGRVALERLRDSPRPCLILLDLMMPDMNGWEFRAHLEADPELSSIPVAVITAATDLKSVAEKLRPIDIFTKPFDIEKVLSLVRKLC